MKVSNIKDIDKIFLTVVDSCEGRVELVTGEGDRLNLNLNYPSMYLWQTFSQAERFRNLRLLLMRKTILIN